jgi:zinc/manganese transport system permease protein
MLADLFALLWAPLLMCLILTGIHAYLGIHVIAREVIFVDIAMAQIAAMGATAAFLAGFDLDSRASWVTALGCTLLGAVALTFTRSRERHVSQEAVIGVIYAVSAAAAVLLADRAPHGAEHVRTMLVGNILSVRADEVARVAVLYAGVGLVHWLCRKPLLLISTNPAAAFDQGWRVRWWDLLFYSTFGLVVASSVRIGGVLLVFSYLIVPSLAGIALGGGIGSRLIIGWVFGGAVSVLGIMASAAFDLPTGATVVCAFGVALALLWGLAPAARYRAAARGAAARGKGTVP